jgi:CheY-like chemotaxis protein
MTTAANIPSRPLASRQRRRPAADDRPLVLVAEDSTTQTRWIDGVLTATGYRVVVAPDGPTALKLIRRLARVRATFRDQ